MMSILTKYKIYPINFSKSSVTQEILKTMHVQEANKTLIYFRHFKYGLSLEEGSSDYLK